MFYIIYVHDRLQWKYKALRIYYENDKYTLCNVFCRLETSIIREKEKVWNFM